MAYRLVIAEAYDAGVSNEYSRLTATDSGKTEFQIMTDILDEFIHAGSVVIDIGAGPGRYSEYLLKRNCKVGLVDLSARSLKAFSDRIESSRFIKNILFNQVSCATQLNWIEDNIADAILLMGPLYHLINADHRSIALANCKRILKPGGFLFTIFMTPNRLLQSGQGVKEYSLGKATNQTYTSITSTNFQGFEVPQYRCNPETAEKMMLSNGFRTIGFRKLDCISSDNHNVIRNEEQSDYSAEKHTSILTESYGNTNPRGEFQQFVSVAIALKP